MFGTAGRMPGVWPAEESKHKKQVRLQVVTAEVTAKDSGTGVRGSNDLKQAL